MYNPPLQGPIRNRLKTIGWAFLIGIQVLSVSFYAFLAIASVVTMDRTPEPPKPERIPTYSTDVWKDAIRGTPYNATTRAQWMKEKDEYLDCTREWGNKSGVCDDMAWSPQNRRG